MANFKNCQFSPVTRKSYEYLFFPLSINVTSNSSQVNSASKGNDCQPKEPLIVQHVLLLNTIRNVENSMENVHFIGRM